MHIISSFLRFAQQILFPHVEEHLGPLTDQEKDLVKLLEFLHIEDFVRNLPSGYRGQQPQARKPIARAFVAKAFLGLEKTSELINRLGSSPNLRRICGWEPARDLPSEATFSRAFAEFADSELPQRLHEAIVRKSYQNVIVGHINRDSTTISGREKAAPKSSEAPKEKRKRGRPRKGEKRAEKEAKRLEKQRKQGLEDMVNDLPKVCDFGSKKNSKGKVEYTKGYKLHLDVADGGVIVNAVLTSASVHDSQVAIPLMLGTSLRMEYLYDVMDAAYDAKEIHDYSKSLGHVPLIDPNNRGKEKRELEPAKKQRYKERSTAERANSRLKDGILGRQVWVKGPTKVFAHLMFGVLALTVDALFRLTA